MKPWLRGDYLFASQQRVRISKIISGGREEKRINK